MNTRDYLEIGRMVMTDYMPRNSESQMLKCLVRFMHREMPYVKVLFTWADGMLGKAGYVYQASGFHYLGYSNTDIYLTEDGTKIHPRQTRRLFRASDTDKRITVRPTFEQMQEIGMKHYKGRQFKYFRYMCGKVEAKRLDKICLIDYRNLENPKEKDLAWKVCVGKGSYIDCGMPPYKTDTRF